MSSFLFESSLIFDDSTQIDRIHQSIIDIQTIQSKDEVIILLDEQLLPYIQNNESQDILGDIFNLILACFTRFPTDTLPIFFNIFDKCRSNSNYIIITASILSYLTTIEPPLQLPDFSSFVSDSIIQIQPQIHSNKNTLQVFGHEIPHQFILPLISDLLLISDLSDRLISDFLPYIFSNNIIYIKNKIIQLITKINSNNLTSSLPQSVSIGNAFFNLFTFDDYLLFIPFISKQTFNEILPQINDLLKDANTIDKNFAREYLYKCRKCNSKIEYIEKVLSSVDLTDIHIEDWNYLKKFNFTLPYKHAFEIHDFPDPDYLFRIYPDFNKLPEKNLTKWILECSDFNTYDNILFTRKFQSHPTFQSKEFWNHLVSLSSVTECPKPLILKFVKLFKTFFDIESFTDIIDDMIFSNYPLNERRITFISYFLVNLRSKYREVFISEEHMDDFLNRVIQINVVPLPRFWEFITFNAINQKLKYESRPILLYGYEFSRGKHNSNQVLPSLFYITNQTDSSKKEITEFIQQNNLRNIVNLSSEALSFVSCAFIFTSQAKKMKFSSLTKKNILPFFAVAFNYINKCNGNLNFSFPEYSMMLQESLKLLENNDSPLYTASVDAILSHPVELKDPNKFPQNDFLQILNILTPFYIKGQFKGDKMIFLSTLFYTSNDDAFESYFSNFGKDLFAYIISNVNEIVESDKFKDYKLNLKRFNVKLVNDTFIDILSKSEAKESRNIIYFLVEKCNNVPSFVFKNSDFYNKSIDVAIKEKNWKDITLLNKFQATYKFEQEIHVSADVPLEVNLKLNNHVTIEKKHADELISIILNDPQPEKNNILFEYLFEMMMKDEPIAMDYLTILLENFYSIEILAPKIILSFFSNEYKKYGDTFIKAICRFYLFDKRNNSFIKRPDFECQTLPVSEFGLSIIAKLYKSISEKPDNYQAFYCLKSIASSFPFLFSQNPQQVFDIVLPVLSDFSLIIDMKDVKDHNINNKVKTVVSALSFLLYALSSLKVLDPFFIWFFDKLDDFDLSQIVGFLLIIRCFIHRKAQLIIYLKKFNFIEKFIKVLDREIPGSIATYIFSNIIILINDFYESYPSLSKIRSISLSALNDEPNEFYTVFDHCLIHLPAVYQPTTLAFIEPNDVIKSYIKMVDEIKPFSFAYDYRKRINKEIQRIQVEEFITHYLRLAPSSKDVNEDLPELPIIPSSNSLTVEMIKYISKQRSWVLFYILCHYKLTLLPEHYDVLIPIINELDRIKANSNESDVSFDPQINQLYSKKQLFKTVINNIRYLSSIFYTITCNKIGKECMVESFNEYLEDPTFHKLDQFLYIYEKDLTNDELRDILFTNFATKILKFSISSNFRMNHHLLLRVADIFIQSKTNELPNEITHLIAFMFILNDKKLTLSALSLCKKIGIKKLENIYDIIDEKFNDAVASFTDDNESFEGIKIFLIILPDIITRKQKMLSELLIKILDVYLSTNNQEALNFFANLINSLAPKKTNNVSYCLSDSDLYDRGKEIYEQSNTINRVPRELKQSSRFWTLYEHVAPKMSMILQNQIYLLEKFQFLLDFPVVMDFQTRSQYFLLQMKKRIKYNGKLYIVADRFDIIESSFEQLHNCSTEQFLSPLRVTFIGEEIAVDQGGVTANFLSLLSQQLFNPVNGLFDSYSTNGGYKPNPNSSSKNNYLEYFKFAGKIIARSLIQNVVVDTHMAPFFYKLILHHPIKLSDLKELDESKYDSLQFYMDNDVDDFDLYFDVDYQSPDGQLIHHELIENGSNIQVTNQNKEEYCSKIAEFYLKSSIKEQCDAFSEGFDSLIPHHMLNIFSPGELDLLICGISEFTDESFKKLVEFQPLSAKDSNLARFFFSAVSKWNKEDRAKLLMFITSTSKFPANINQFNMIIINVVSRSNRLPVAHTCFRQMDLPNYESEEILNEKLLLAVRHAQQFALC